MGDTFVINITVVNVTDLQGWQIMLGWDASLLDLVDVTLPSDYVFSQIDPPRQMITAEATGPDYVTYTCTYENAPYWTFNGTGRLCQITLKIKQGVSASNPMFSCNLSLLDQDAPDGTWLVDSLNRGMKFTPVNGTYIYRFATILVELFPTCPPPYVPSSTPRIHEPVLVKAEVIGIDAKT